MALARAIEKRLQALADPVRAAGVARFFKTGRGEYAEGDRFLGLRVPVVRQFAREHQELSLRDVAALLESPWHEVRLLALLILVRQYGRADAAGRTAIHRLYLRSIRAINNWDLVDCSAPCLVGEHLNGGGMRHLRALARSRNVWSRRIAMLATFHAIKQGNFEPALEIARMLRDDPHDLIHKAAGWMLREIGNRDRAVEEAFLREHAARMPRTMLRYAIERFPERLRRRYLVA